MKNNAMLSQRAGRAFTTRTIQMLGPLEKNKLIEAIEQAKDFDDLAPKYQELIEKAEQEMGR